MANNNERQRIEPANGQTDDLDANVRQTLAANHGPPNTTAPPNGTRRLVFTANQDLQFPQATFRPPPDDATEVAAQINGNPRRVIDIRTLYLRRLDEYKLRLMTETIDAIGLRTMLENADNYVKRIVKYVEDREDSGVLDQAELDANQNLWEQAQGAGDFIKINIRTKLQYLDAGGPQSAELQNKLAQVRRLNAKIEPFGGEWESWCNFKSKWVEYYHNCTDLSKMDLLVKLDEFIVPRSEAYNLIALYVKVIECSVSM